MALRRSTLPLLGAFLALFAVPASASADVMRANGLVSAFSVSNGTPVPTACAALATPIPGPDVTAPTDETIPPPTAWSDSDIPVTLSASDDTGVTGFKWRIDGAPFVDADDDDVIALTTAGQHTVETCVFDAAGNYDGSTFTYRLDNGVPTDLTDSGTIAWTPTTRNVTVTGADSTSPIDHVEWELDGQGVQSGPNNRVVPIVADGTHTLRTQVVDSAGNESGWTVHTVRIDATAPIDVTAGPGAWQTAPYPLTITGTDAHSGISQVEYRIDSGPAITVSAPANVTVSGDGVHTVHTRIRDTAGNWSGLKSSTIVRVDTTAPDNQTPTGPGNTVWIAHDYAVIVSGADQGSGVREVQWRVDGGQIRFGASGFEQATVTGTGPHTLETRVLDNAGNGNWRTETINIDKVKPLNTTPTPAAALAVGSTVTITGTDAHSSIAGVEWTIDGDPTVHSGPDGSQVEFSAPGPHTLRTQVIDAAGNAGGWRTDTFTVNPALNNDTSPPVDKVATVPSGWRRNAFTFTLDADDNAGGTGVDYVLVRDDGTQSEHEKGETFTVTDEGVHYFETQVYDVAGNHTQWRGQWVRIDKTQPADTAVIPTEWSNTNTFVISGDDVRTGTATPSGIARMEYSLDGAAFVAAANGDTVNVGGDGPHTVITRAIDRAENGSIPATHTFKVDRQLPANTSAVPASTWRTTPLSLTLSGTDSPSGLAKMQWRLNGGDVHDGGPAVVQEDGQYTLETWAVDLAGNQSAPRPDTVRVDVTAPQNITETAPDGWIKTPYAVEIKGDDGEGSDVALIEAEVDGAPATTPNVTITGDGEHTLRTKITDQVGHHSGWREETIKIDTAAPTAGIACDAGTATWSTAPVSCAVTADGGPSGLGSLTLAGADGGSASVTPGTAATVSGDGTHVLRLNAVDGAGNPAATEATVYVDRTAPAADLSCTAVERTYSCTANASDATSGLASLGYSVDGGAVSRVTPGASFTVAKGSVQLHAADAAGNANVTAPLTLAAIPVGATVRIVSTPVYLKGRKTTDNMVGALHAVRSATGTVSLDLRPLAVGRGRYRVEIALKSGKRSRKVKRDFKVGRTGALPRMSASLSRAVERTTVTLTVRKRVGGHWRRHAGTKLVLAK